MEPLLTAQTRLNILASLAWLEVKHDIRFSDHPNDNDDRSRVRCVDPDGLLLRHVKANPEQWDHDSGRNHDAHGWKVRGSWRSHTTPSVQVCQIDARGGQYPYILEIDIDEASPFVDLPKHTREVLWNMAPRMWLQRPRQTDPAKVAAILRQRGILA